MAIAMKTTVKCVVEGCEREAKTMKMCGKHYLYSYRHGQPISPRTAPLVSREWIDLHVSWGDPKECLIFPFGRTSSGYATINDGKNKIIYAHRYMCIQAHGMPPSEFHEVAHNCGDRGCVNPHHLRWDTRSGNAADKIKHGTLMYGERHPSGKLTLDQAREVFKRAWNGEKNKDIASEFGISASNVSVIKNGGSWKIDLGDDLMRVKSNKTYLSYNKGVSHLSNEQVAEIKHLISIGTPIKDIANVMGVSYGRIRSIKSGQTYKGEK